jgi:uncharacterized protein YbjQ (UPF0145 family)
VRSGVGFFRREEDADDDAAAARARIEDGGIPAGAEARLKLLGTEGGLFTSGLSVNEFALLHRLGPQPLAQVMGASVVGTGWQYLPALDPGLVVNSPWYGPTVPGRAYQNRMTDSSPAQLRNYVWHADVVCELDVLTAAWNLARRRALDRLAEEARQVGADAVVGVRLDRGDHDLGRGTIQYVITGTAIRNPGGSGASWPSLTDVSVQDYWRLARAGYEAVGLLAATVVVFASPSRATRLRRARSTSRNQELDELTRAFHAARETIRAALRGQVADAHASGAVGVEISHSVHRDKLSLASALASASHRGWHRGSLGIPYFVSGRGDADRRGWVITMHAAGTAVRRRARSADAPPQPQIRMGMR